MHHFHVLQRSPKMLPAFDIGTYANPASSSKLFRLREIGVEERFVGDGRSVDGSGLDVARGFFEGKCG